VPHLLVADGFGMQVDASKLLGDQVQQVGLGQAFDLDVEVKELEDVPGNVREGLDIVTLPPPVVPVEMRGSPGSD